MAGRTYELNPLTNSYTLKKIISRSNVSISSVYTHSQSIDAVCSRITNKRLLKTVRRWRSETVPVLNSLRNIPRQNDTQPVTTPIVIHRPLPRRAETFPFTPACIIKPNAWNWPRELEVKNRYLKRTYKITIEDYNRILIEQDYVCAICKHSQLGWDYLNLRKKDLFVDHNHKTGKVRGLLCNSCNSSLSASEHGLEKRRGHRAYLENPPFERVNQRFTELPLYSI